MSVLIGLCFRGKVRGNLLRESRTSWIWYDSGTTSESKSCLCRAFAEPHYNLVRHGRSTTSDLGLRLYSAKVLAGTAHASHVWPLCGTGLIRGVNFQYLVSLRPGCSGQNANFKRSFRVPREETEKNKFYFSVVFLLSWGVTKSLSHTSIGLR